MDIPNLRRRLVRHRLQAILPQDEQRTIELAALKGAYRDGLGRRSTAEDRAITRPDPFGVRLAARRRRAGADEEPDGDGT